MNRYPTSNPDDVRRAEAIGIAPIDRLSVSREEYLQWQKAIEAAAAQCSGAA